MSGELFTVVTNDERTAGKANKSRTSLFDDVAETSDLFDWPTDLLKQVIQQRIRVIEWFPVISGRKCGHFAGHIERRAFANEHPPGLHVENHDLRPLRLMTNGRTSLSDAINDGHRVSITSKLEKRVQVSTLICSFSDVPSQ